jgi:hypothetical protein
MFLTITVVGKAVPGAKPPEHHTEAPPAAKPTPPQGTIPVVPGLPIAFDPPVKR